MSSPLFITCMTMLLTGMTILAIGVLYLTSSREIATLAIGSTLTGIGGMLIMVSWIVVLAHSRPTTD